MSAMIKMWPQSAKRQKASADYFDFAISSFFKTEVLVATVYLYFYIFTECLSHWSLSTTVSMKITDIIELS